MRFLKAVSAAGLLAVLAAPSVRAVVVPIGVIETYDAAKRVGTMSWEQGGQNQAPVYFTADAGVPALKAGDRVRVDMRLAPGASPLAAYSPKVPWVTGLAAPGDTSPPLNPYAALAASLNKKKPAPAAKPAAPAPPPTGVVKTFDAGRGEGTILPGGQTAAVTFRPWPAFAFSPKPGDRLRYASVEQWGTAVLWAAPLADADPKP